MLTGKMLNLLKLVVLVTCVYRISARATKEVSAWEGESVTLSCDPDYRIRLNSVLFANNLRRPTCQDPDAVAELKPSCQTLNSCTVVISNTIFQNSTCQSGTRHRIKINYDCLFDQCIVKYCANGASCITQDDMSAQCTCNGQLTGDNCDVSPCASSPCENDGTCAVDANGMTVCACKGDYSGPTCSVSSCTPNPCQNGGTCSVNGNGVATCTCIGEGYGFGTFCSESPCTNNPCENGGSCSVDGSGRATCACLGDWQGSTCTESPCQSAPCQNGATCVVLPDGSPSCICTGRYQGPLCADCLPTIGTAGDGIDNDCDGDIDEEPVCGGSTATDSDSDGRTNEDCSCQTSSMVFGDNIDNDCNGSVDEDTCPGNTDSDGDGNLYEDCATVIVEGR